MKNQAYAELAAHEELFAPVFGDYAVPSDLREFDAQPTDAAIRRLGEETFLRWLHYEMKGRTAPVRKSPLPLACEEPEAVVEYAPQRFVETTFHPDYPEPEDFARGEDDEEFRHKAHTAKIQTLMALKMCSECPISKTCLDLSVIHSPADGVWGVFGGVPESSRRLIANRFHKLRRAYNSTKTHEMTETQRERYRERAAALTFE